MTTMVSWCRRLIIVAPVNPASLLWGRWLRQGRRPAAPGASPRKGLVPLRGLTALLRLEAPPPCRAEGSPPRGAGCHVPGLFPHPKQSREQGCPASLCPPDGQPGRTTQACGVKWGPSWLSPANAPEQHEVCSACKRPPPPTASTPREGPPRPSTLLTFCSSQRNPKWRRFLSSQSEV